MCTPRSIGIGPPTLLRIRYSLRNEGVGRFPAFLSPATGCIHLHRLSLPPLLCSVTSKSLARDTKFMMRYELNLELELIQTQMTQKPMLRAEVYARALRASQNRKEDSV